MTTRRKQSTEEVAYLAGLMDADGYIGICKGRPQLGNTKNYGYTLTVNLTNTNYEVMEWVKERFGGNIYKRKMPKNKNWKQSYNWIVSSKKAEEVLRLIEPYLVIKKAQAQLGIELRDGWVKDNRGTPPEETERREKIYQRYLDLNATGLVQRERLSSEAPLSQEDEAIV